MDDLYLAQIASRPLSSPTHTNLIYLPEFPITDKSICFLCPHCHTFTNAPQSKTRKAKVCDRHQTFSKL